MAGLVIPLLFAAGLVDERAVAASVFVDSIGIVTHFAYWDTPYGNRYDVVAQRLTALGLHHVRDTVVIGQTLVCERERQLAARGLRFIYVTQPAMPPDNVGAWASCVGPAIEGFEGPNEYDISHPASDDAWAESLRTFQHTLYTAVKSNPATRELPVIGPSLTSGGAFRAVGDLSASMDLGNMHDYFSGREPETNGWGNGGYGSIAYNLGVARPVSDDKQIYATESGYGTSTVKGDVPEEVQAAYVPRLFFDQFAAGVPRTYEYELLDEGRDPYSRYGLLRGDLSEKPAYTAMQSLLALLHDSGSKPQRDRLRFALDGETQGVRHLLLQKHDGRFYLALWSEHPSVDPDTRVALPLPADAVDIRVDGDAALTPLTYGSANRLDRGRASRRTLRITLRDRVVIVEIAVDQK